MTDKKSSLDLEIPFENKIFPCFNIKIFRDKNIIQVLEGREIKRTFKLSSFPKDMDMNKVETISALIAVVREEGVDALRKKYKLRTVKAK